jgi:hypothetical protein
MGIRYIFWERSCKNAGLAYMVYGTIGFLVMRTPIGWSDRNRLLTSSRARQLGRACLFTIQK